MQRSDRDAQPEHAARRPRHRRCGAGRPAPLPDTDILWASPSCTFWSQARGERQDFADQPTDPTLFDLANLDDAEDEPPLPNEARDRSRALMHDVPRFAEYHRYKAVIVENVTPLLKWVHFPKWIARMRNLGYLHRVLTLNSAFSHQGGAPAPQLRDRVYVVYLDSLGRQWRISHPGVGD